MLMVRSGVRRWSASYATSDVICNLLVTSYMSLSAVVQIRRMETVGGRTLGTGSGEERRRNNRKAILRMLGKSQSSE